MHVLVDLFSEMKREIIVSCDHHPTRMKFVLIPSKNGEMDQGLGLQFCKFVNRGVQICSFCRQASKNNCEHGVDSVQSAVL